MTTYIINDLPSDLVIGRQTETGVLDIRIDCAPWLALWPELDLYIWVTPPGGGAQYPAHAYLDGEVLVWEVNSGDTAVEGRGTIEVVGIADGLRKLSTITTTQVLRTTTRVTTTIPDPARPWVEQVLEAASAAQDSAYQAAVNADKTEKAVVDNETAQQAAALAEAAKDAALEATAEAANVLASIPGDYKALSENVATLTEDLADLTPVIWRENIYDTASDGIVMGKFLNKNGQEVALAQGVISYFVPVEYGKTYTLLSGHSFMGEDCVYIHLYDENFNLLTNGDDITCVASLSDKTSTGTKTFEVNLESAKYTRFSYVADAASWQYFNVLTHGLSDDVEVFTPSNISKLGGVLVAINVACNDYEPIGIPTFESGYFSYNSNELKNVYYHKRFDVAPGETYKVCGYSHLNVMPVVLTDGEKVIDYFPKAETETPTFGSFVFEIPANVTTMYLNRIVMGNTLREYYVSAYKKTGVTLKHHEHKKLAIIGDSLSQPFNGVPLPYHRLLEAHDNFTVENFCRSGHGYYMDEDADYAFWRQARRVTDDTDVCLIFGSFNDLKYYDHMGDVSDTGTSTICGCANTTFDTLSTNHVGLKVGVILPTPWGLYRPGYAKSDDYVAKIKAICQKRGIPLLDLYHESGMRPWESAFNALYYYNSDYTHPNSNGHKEYIYPHVREFVKKLVT